MLLPSIQVSSPTSLSQHSRKLFQFIEHMSLIGGKVHLEFTQLEWSQICQELLDIIHSAPCLLAGPVPNIEIVHKLLDKGLLVALLDDPTGIQNLCVSVPRERVGLILRCPLANVVNKIQNYCPIVGHFQIR